MVRDIITYSLWNSVKISESENKELKKIYNGLFAGPVYTDQEFYIAIFFPNFRLQKIGEMRERYLSRGMGL